MWVILAGVGNKVLEVKERGGVIKHLLCWGPRWKVDEVGRWMSGEPAGRDRRCSRACCSG